MATFKEAFATARKGGKREFTWQGKRYTTKLREEVSSAPAKSKKPVGRPARSVASSVSAKDAKADRSTPVASSASTKDAKADRATPAKPRKAPSFVEGLTMGSAARTKAAIDRERERRITAANARISGRK